MPSAHKQGQRSAWRRNFWARLGAHCGAAEYPHTAPQHASGGQAWSPQTWAAAAAEAHRIWFWSSAVRYCSGDWKGWRTVLGVQSLMATFFRLYLPFPTQLFYLENIFRFFMWPMKSKIINCHTRKGLLIDSCLDYGFVVGFWKVLLCCPVQRVATTGTSTNFWAPDTMFSVQR